MELVGARYMGFIPHRPRGVRMNPSLLTDKEAS